MRHLIARSAVVVGLGTIATYSAAEDEAESRAACEALATLDTPAFRVDTAEWVAGDAPLPAHCLFRVTLNPRPSSIDGVSLGIGFELRLPLEWNGRFLFQGGGGLNGVLNPALGNV